MAWWESSRHGYMDKGRVERGIERELYFTEPPDLSIYFSYILPCRSNSFTRSLKETIRSVPRGGPIAFVLREQVSQIFHSGGA